MAFPGVDGILGTRASLVLDGVLLSLGVALPVLAFSLYSVRVRRNFALHRRLQLCLGAVLLVVVTIFELDMRFGGGWRERAMPSPHYESGLVAGILYVHIAFATATVLLWIFVTWRAMRRFPIPPVPGPHSRAHAFWARITVAALLGTAATAGVFYYTAFIASS